jgi:hypothetical protein
MDPSDPGRQTALGLSLAVLAQALDYDRPQSDLAGGLVAL